jgi:hypothetical protein
MPMTTEQIVELAQLARGDAALWAQMKEREREIEKRHADAAAQGRDPLDPEALLDPHKLPSLATLVADLVKHRYGADERFSHDALLLTIRRAVREDLGLPTDLGFGPGVDAD